MEDGSKDILHYGACITLALSEGSYIVSGGFIDDSLHLHLFSPASDQDFISSVFRVLPSVTYVIQGEVLDHIQKSPKGISTAVRDRIAALDENLESELKTNIQTYAKLKGEPVKFGAAVQLEHVSSHKYVTISSHENAERERDNLKLSLQDFSNEHSLFKVETCYQYQKEGDGNIRYGDKIRLAVLVPEMNKYAYIHCSPLNQDQSPFQRLRTYASIKISMTHQDILRGPDDKEVNGSIEDPTDWQVSQFIPYIQENSDCVLVGDHVWLTKSEIEICLTATLRPDSSSYVGFTKNQYDSNGMWKIEAEVYKVGGMVRLGVGFRLRHISSGWYLGANMDEVNKPIQSKISSMIASSLHPKRPVKLTLMKFSEESTLWRFKPINSRKKSKFLLRDEYFKIEHAESKGYLHTIESGDETVPILNPKDSESSIFKISRSDPSIVWETLFLINSLPILQNFPAFIKSQRIEHNSAELITKNREFKRYVGILRKCMENLTLFCFNKLQSMMSLNHKYGQVESNRQNILREQHFLDALGNILQHAFSGPYELKRISKQLLDSAYDKDNERFPSLYKPNVYSKLLSIEYTSSQQVKQLQQDFETAQFKDLVEIVEQTYELISVVCSGNRDNKKKAFLLFPVIQQHAPFIKNATSCMQMIVQDNEELLLQVHKTDGAGERGNLDILLSDRDESLIRYFTYLLRVRRYSALFQ